MSRSLACSLESTESLLLTSSSFPSILSLLPSYFPDNCSTRSPLCPSLHNSIPAALKRVTALALVALPVDASNEDKADCKIEFIERDLSSKEDIERVFAIAKNKGGIFGTIHVAAHKAVGESGEKPLQYYANNITATINLLEVS